MKQFLLFTLLSMFTLGLSAQVIYVDADATGTGDGSSWADAYTDLNEALLAATSGSSVWIADGTYTTPESASFFIDKEMTVLGGFNGTETEASAADPTTNLTILSGDVMGNDIAGSYDSLAFLDNNRVLFIQDTNDVSAYTVTLDGFTIANGGLAEDIPADGSLLDYSGGGLRSYARLAASRLTFTANRANFGSALALIFPTTDGSTFDDITLTGNTSSTSHQFYMNSVNDITVSNSNFIGADGEEQASGFISANFAVGVTIDNCSFSSLSTPASRGAGIRAADCDRFTVSNSTFDGLTADLGGAVQISQTADAAPVDGETMGLDDYVFENCTFTNNFALQRGAAITSFNANANLVGSTFTDNRGGTIGGAFYLQPADGRSYLFNFENTTVSDNQDSGAGGAICLLVFGTADVEGTIINSTMNGNVSNGGQGAVAYLQGINHFTITDSEFSENVAGFGTIISRGAVGMDIVNTTFEDNGNSTDAFQGAGVAIYMDPGSTGFSVDSSEFIGNTVTQNGDNIRSGGAAIYALGNELSEMPFVVTNSTFSSNAAADGTTGGAILALGSFGFNVDNSDFIDNTAGGEGGAINVIVDEFSRDTTDGVITVTPEVFAGTINSSRFFNSVAGTQGGAIATQGSVMDISNSVFVNNLATGSDPDAGKSGGAIIFNGNGPSLDGDNNDNVRENGSFVLDANFIHNTFAINSYIEDEGFGDDLALFQPGDINDTDSNSMKIVLLNNAFIGNTERPSIEIEPGADNAEFGFVAVGDVFVESLGGNFYNAEISPDFELNASDIVNEDVEATDVFVDIEDDAGEGPNADLVITDPLSDNPLINGGVTNALVPDTDVRGNPRGDFPDIGAYEADQGAVSTAEPIENSGLDITFFPNPTQDILNVRNDETTIEQFTLVVADQTGRILKANRFSGSNNRVDFTNVPAGVYNLQVVVGGKIYSKQIVKQ
ncbi:T9SS type A sorting domain-containing protein [Neolewinella aurantiaca]|uniref:T9SS type A sorting domain-containing protein n=1 Tax=Neolewinella aurantiaca TaxID=2602767 RepID=A0A5C7FHG2_9BACT|nr:T9SS type A sorting domain-containing protein [Neolewinella aurantiaca]TXF90636.1 T9SS type A sorting domain-containing protein [Neolewinella aurantiaca]